MKLAFSVFFRYTVNVRRSVMNKGVRFMGRFFNMDNKFFVFMGKVADLCLLNLVCILCCIPVVTAGASLTALYYVTQELFQIL